MDNTVSVIAEHAQCTRFSDLPAPVVTLCKHSIVDAFGCALGGMHAEPSKIARDFALRTSLPHGARVMGTDHRTLPELAAFANGVMVRYLDANDAFQGGGGHPSDMLSAILAAAEMTGADGRELVTAVALAYDVYYNLWRTARVRSRGIDHVFYAVAGAAVGAAKALRLDSARIAHALSLGIVPNIALDATRYGVLGMWKGCAGGNAARNGLFAALLAQQGMTAPEKPIEGDHGLHKLVGDFSLLPFSADRPHGLHEVTLKCFPAEGHALSPMTVALELAQQIDNPDDIEKITIYTYWFAWEVIGREPEKWRPTTREAADHSMPYIVAALLVERKFSEKIYSEQCLKNPRIRRLLETVEVKEDGALTKRFPERMPCRIEVQFKNGQRKIAETDYPRGHYSNPMNGDEVSAKFRGYAAEVLASDQTEALLSALWALEDVAHLNTVFDLMVPR